MKLPIDLSWVVPVTLNSFVQLWFLWLAVAVMLLIKLVELLAHRRLNRSRK